MILALTRRSLLSIAAAGAFAVGLPAWLLWPAQITIDRPPPLGTTSLRTRTTLLLNEALSRPPFSPDRVPVAEVLPAAADTAVAEPAPPAPPPELVGTIAGRRIGVALLRIQSGETARARVGEAVDGWTVLAIGDRRAIVEQNGRRETLSVSFKSEARAQASGPPPVSPATMPGTTDLPDATKVPQ